MDEKKNNQNKSQTTRSIGKSSSISFNNEEAGSFQMDENRQHNNEIKQTSRQVSEIESSSRQNTPQPVPANPQPAPSQKNADAQEKSRLRKVAGIAGKVTLGVTVGVANPAVYSAIKNSRQKKEEIQPSQGETTTDDTARNVGKGTEISFDNNDSPENFDVKENKDKQIQKLTHETIQQTMAEGGNSPSQKNKERNVQQSKKRRAAGLAGKIALGVTVGVANPAIYSNLKKSGEQEKVPEQEEEKEKPKKPPSRFSQAGKKAFKITSMFTGAGLIYHFLPRQVQEKVNKVLFPKKDEKTLSPPHPQTEKSVKGYTKGWIDKTLKKAAQEGYDRFALVRKITDLKVWQSRAWKVGSAVLASPFTTAAVQVNRFLPKYPGEKPSSPASHPHQAVPTNPFGIRTLTGGVWRRMGRSRLSIWNKPVARRPGPIRVKGKSNSARNSIRGKATSELKSRALKLAMQEPHVRIAIIVVIAAVVILLGTLYLMMVIISAVAGGGGNSSGGIGGGVNPGGGGNNNGGGGPTQNSNPIPGFTLQKTVSDTTLPSASEITYTLSYTFTPGAQTQENNITIHDNVPDNTVFEADKTTGNYTLSTDGKTISWALSDSKNAGMTSFSFSVIPTSDNATIENSAWADAASSTSNPGNPNASASNDCNGYYADYLAAHPSPYGNYGDQSCNFATDNAGTQNEIAAMLQQLDPQYASYWIGVVIPRESAWIPIAYLENSTSGNGAYGLFQMNPEGKSTSGPNDVGNVDWRQQVPNAVKTRQLVGWGYWGGGPN